MNDVRKGECTRMLALWCSIWVLIPNALSCSNPTLHPEWAEYNALVESLGNQPKLPLQILYRVSPEKSGDDTRVVSLAFRPTQETYDQAAFSVTPSAHLSLLTPTENIEITRKPVKLTVAPQGSGVHHLRLVVTLSVDGKTQQNTTLIPVIAGLRHAPAPISSRLLRSPAPVVAPVRN